MAGGVLGFFVLPLGVDAGLQSYTAARSLLVGIVIGLRIVVSARRRMIGQCGGLTKSGSVWGGCLVC